MKTSTSLKTTEGKDGLLAFLTIEYKNNDSKIHEISLDSGYKIRIIQNSSYMRQVNLIKGFSDNQPRYSITHRKKTSIEEIETEIGFLEKLTKNPPRDRFGVRMDLYKNAEGWTVWGSNEDLRNDKDRIETKSVLEDNRDIPEKMIKNFG